MNHEGAVHLIGELLHGRLRGGLRDEMLSHIRSCEECRALSRTYATLAEKWADLDGHQDHPPSDLIVRYALGEEGLEEKDRDWVAKHVLSCRPCAAELEVTGEAEAELARDEPVPAATPPARRTGSGYHAPGIAAAFVLIVLAYPAYLGLFEVPRINERIALLEEQRVEVETPKPRGGAVYSVFLRSPVRSAEAEVPSIPMPAGYELGELEVDPGPLEEYQAAGVGRFSIRDASGVTVWSQQLTFQEMRAFIKHGGTIELLVPEEHLPAGLLTLSVSSGSEPMFDADFVVVRD